MRFREDINGLRALAVIAVILFHSGFEMFKGGFLGVDVFFVISGFLITLNIIRQSKTDSFSIASFYDKRIRRILPALIFLMFITTIFAFLFLLPYDLKNYGQSLVSTSIGANNILLYLTTGYWSMAAEMKPLYHSWSLGVEEQYYFIIPLIFTMFYKKTRILSIVLILLFIASWIFSFTIEHKEFNFLMIITRFWELGVGTLLAIYIDRFSHKSNTLSIIGLFLIFISCIYPYLISSNQAIYNLIPVIGTALIVAFSPENGHINRICSNKLIRIIGLSSYSIYLLHQPILAFYKLSSDTEPLVINNLLVALLSIPLGMLMWRYIENPFRDKKIINNKQFYSLIIVCSVLLITCGLVLNKTYGLQHNIDKFEKYSYGNNPQNYGDAPYALEKKEFTTNNPKMLIIGDSFARDFINCINEVELTKGYEVIYLYRYYDNIDIPKELLSVSDVIFYVSSYGWIDRQPDLDKVAKERIELKKNLEKHSKGKIFFIGTKNYGINNNFVRFMNWESSKDYLVDIVESIILVNQIEKTIFKDRHIDLLGLTSVGDKTRLFTDNHRFISFDTGHLTRDGAHYIGRLLLEKTQFSKLMLPSKLLISELY